MTRWRSFKSNLDSKQVTAPLILVILVMILLICIFALVGFLSKFLIDQVNSGDNSARCRAVAGAQRDLAVDDSLTADRAADTKLKEVLEALGNGDKDAYRAKLGELHVLNTESIAAGQRATTARQEFAKQVVECG